MNTIGIVAVSLAAGLFLALLLAGLGLLIWQAFQNRKAIREIQSQRDAVSAETKALLAGNQAEMKSAIESAKSSFATIRTEMKALLDDHRKQTKAILDEHRKAMQAGIEKINAEALISVAARLTQVALRAEKAVGVLQAMMADAESRATHDYAPDEYAPETSAFGGPPSNFSVSQVARLDEEAQQVEAPQVEMFPAGE